MRHLHSASSDLIPDFKSYHLQRNKLLTLWKNLPLSLLIRFGLEITVYDLLSLTYSLFIEQTFAGITARLSAISQLPIILKKRQKVQKMRRVSIEEIIEWLEASENPLKIWQRKK